MPSVNNYNPFCLLIFFNNKGFGKNGDLLDRLLPRNNSS